MLYHIFTKFTRQITSTLMSKNDSKFSVSAKAPCFTSIWQQLKFLFFTFKDSFAKAITSFKAHESWFCNEWKCKRNKRKNVLDFHTIPADEFAMHFSFCILWYGDWENERKWKRYNKLYVRSAFRKCNILPEEAAGIRRKIEKIFSFRQLFLTHFSI